MSMERLIVKNFGPIKDVDIEIPRLLVFIGDQASGKSTLARLVYIFKLASSMLTRFGLMPNESPIDMIELKNTIVNEIKKYFGYCFFDNNTFIEYRYYDKYFIRLRFINNEINIKLSPDLEMSMSNIEHLWNEFIIANFKKRGVNRLDSEKNERKRFSEDDLRLWVDISLIADELNEKTGNDCVFEYLQASRADTNTPTLSLANPMLNSTVTRQVFNLFEDMVKEYDRANHKRADFVNKVAAKWIVPRALSIDRNRYSSNEYHERFSKKAGLCFSLINLSYKLIKGLFGKDDEEGYGITITESVNKRRFVPYRFLSSGQQSEFPLIVCIVHLGVEGFLYFVQKLPFNSLVIEEPEAHVYPQNQFNLMKLLSISLALNESSRYVITTHSPYILSSLHALSAYGLADGDVEALTKYEDLVPLKSDKENLEIYLLKDGYAKSLRDEESGLFDTSEIDSVAEEINEVFDESIIADELKKGMRSDG